MSDINEVIDGLGRTIGGLGRNIDEVRSRIRSASAAMGKAVKFINEKINEARTEDAGSAATAAATQKLIDEIEKLTPEIRRQIEQEKELIESVKDLAEQVKKEREDGKKKTGDLRGEEKFTQAVRDFNSAIKHLTDKCCGPTGHLNMSTAGSPSGTKNRRGIPQGTTASGGKGGGRAGRPTAADMVPDPEGFDKLGREAAGAFSLGLEYATKRHLAAWATGIGTAMLGGRGDIGQFLFAGSVRDATQFREEARLLAFEIEGMSQNTRNMQANFADMGEVAKQTGKSVDVMQRVYMTNMRKGFKGQGAELKKVLKSGLQLSTMIGSEADSTAGMFADWSRTLGMSSDKMAQMAIDSKNIARSTGVTGDELVHAMKSSEGILKNLRNQGNLTSNAARNVIKGMAEAQKSGVEEKYSQMADMMTSTNKFMEGDAKTRGFIITMGGTEAALAGRGMEDRQNLAGMAERMNAITDEFTRGAAKSVEDIANLGDDDRKILARTLSMNFGMEIYEFEKMFEILRKSSMSLGDQFKELTATTNNANESAEAKAQAESKITQLMSDAGMGFTNKLLEVARKDGKNLGDAFGETASRMRKGDKDDMRDLVAKGSGRLDAGTLARADAVGQGSDQVKAMLIAAKTMSERGKELNISGIKDLGPEILDAVEKAQKTGKNGELVALMERMQEMGKEIEVEAKTGVTPMEELSQQINKLNQTLRKLVSGPLGILIDTLGWVGLALTSVGMSAFSLYMILPEKIGNFVVNMKKIFKQFERFGLPKIFKRAMPKIPAGEGWIKDKPPNLFSKAYEGIAHLFEKMQGLLSGTFSGGFKGLLGKFNWLKEKALESISAIWNGGFKGFLGNIWSGLIGLRERAKLILASIGDFFKRNLGGIIGKITGLFKGADGAKSIGNFITNMKNLGRAAWSGAKPLNMIAGLYNSVGKLARANPVGFFIGSAIDTIWGAVDGYSNAAGIFGKKTEDVTLGMRISAGAAGGVVGFLDSLTFGLLRLTGITKPLTVILANVIQGFMWMGEGIKEGFMDWIPWITESFGAIGESIGRIFGMLGGGQYQGQEWTVFFEVMKKIGSFLGQGLGGTLWVVVKVIEVVVKAIEGFVWAIQKLVEWIGSAIAKVRSWLPSWLGGTPAPASTTRPAMAEGGVVTRPTEALIGEAGPEAVIPLDKLGSIAKSDPVKSTDFNKEKALMSAKKANSISQSSNDILKMMESRGRTASQGFFVNDTKTRLLLQLLFSQMGYIYESLEAGLNFISGESEADADRMKVARADARLRNSEVTTKLAGDYGGTEISAMMDERARSVLNSTAAGVVGREIGFKDAVQEEKYNAKRLKLEERVLSILAAIKEANEEYNKHALKRGSIYTHDIHMVDEMGILNDTIEKSTPSAEVKVPPAEAKAMSAQFRQVGPSKGPYKDYHAKAVADAGNFEQNYRTMPESMWSARDHVDSMMERQSNMFEASPNFDTSAQMASVEGLAETLGRDSLDYGKGKSMKLQDATDKLFKGLEDKAMERLEEENKEALAAMDKEAAGLKKKYMWNKWNGTAWGDVAAHPQNLSSDEDARARWRGGVESGTGKALIDSQRKKRKFYEDNIGKYYLEDTAVATKPGEDPNMLYESQKSAKSRTVERYEGSADREAALIAAQEQELAGLKVRRKQTRAKGGWGGWLMRNSTVAQAMTGYKDPEKDELSSIDKRMEEIEGKKRGRFYWTRTQDAGSLGASKARLAMWKKEAADPSVVEREVIGKNEWTGTSAMSFNDPQLKGNRRTKISPDGSTIEVQTPIRRSLGSKAEDAAAIRAAHVAVAEIAEATGASSISGLGGPTEKKIEGNLMKSTFQVPEQYREAMIASMKDMEPASDAVLEQNIEQTKKLGTVEEASARSLEPGSIYTHDIHLEKLLGGIIGDDRLAMAANTTANAIESASSYHATPVGQHAVPVVREEVEGAGDVQPVHLRDIAESILKDKVGGEAGTSKLQSDELARMEEISNRQYAEMQQIREGIQEMVSLLKPTGSVIGSGQGESVQTKFARKQVRPTVYGQMRDGKPGGGPNRSVYKDF